MAKAQFSMPAMPAAPKMALAKPPAPPAAPKGPMLGVKIRKPTTKLPKFNASLKTGI